MKSRKSYCLSCLLLTMMSVSHAGEAQNRIVLRELSDAELDNMQGKYISGRNTVYFGVVMQTQWRMVDGYTHDMRLHMDFDLGRPANRGHPFIPTLTINRSSTIGSEYAGDGYRHSSASSRNNSLQNVSGVLQTIQAAGDDNLVANDISWEIADHTSLSSSSWPDSDLVEIDHSGSSSHKNDVGVISEVHIDPGKLGYTVHVPDKGSVTHLLRGGNASGRGILQSTQLSSDYNQIRNQIRLSIGVDTHRPRGGAINTDRAMGYLQGFR